MGVKGLLKSLGFSPKDGKSSICEVAGKKVAVDSMVYLTQFIKSNMEIVDKFFIGYPVDFDTELALFLDSKLGMFQEMRCDLLFVVDGDRNPLKAEENRERQKSANDAKNMLKEIAENSEDTDLDVVHRLMKQSVSVSPAVVSSLQVYCQRKSYELVSAPYECDPMLVSLQSSGIVDYIVTIDQDLVALGGEGVIYNIDYKQWYAYQRQKSSLHIPDEQKLKLQHIKCNIVSFGDVINKLNDKCSHKKWDHFSFLVYCNLLGTDFQRHGVSQLKAEKVMELFFTRSVTIDNLAGFIDNLNTSTSANYVKFSGESFVTAINALLHPIVFHISRDDFSSKKYRSSKTSCISVKLLSDLISPSSGRQVSQRSSSTTSGLTALGTKMKRLLGFSIFTEGDEHYSSKLSTPSRYSDFFTVSTWIRTDEKLPRISYSSSRPRDTMINFEKTPPRWFTVPTLRKYLSARGVNDPANIDHSQVVVNVEKVTSCEKQLGRCMVDPRYTDRPFSQYDDFSALIDFIEDTATKYTSSPAHHSAINNIFRYVFPEITEDTFREAMLGYNRPAVKDRAERCLKQGYLVTTDMRLIKAKAKVDGSMKWVYILEGGAYASMEKEEHSIQMVVGIREKRFLLSPVSRCTCMVGRLFCSHQIAVLMFIYQAQKHGLGEVLQLLPPPAKRLDKHAIPLQLYTGTLNSWKAERNKDCALVYDELRQVHDDNDEEREIAGRAEGEKRSELDDILHPTVEDQKRRYVSCTDMAEKIISDLRFETEANRNENDHKKGRKQRKRKRVSCHIDLSTLEESHYKMYYSGPSESRSAKIEQYETLELLDELFHKVKSLRLCVLSHYLEYTREHRRRVLEHLRSNVPMVYLKFGTGKIPPGWCILADRGFRHDASKLPNINPIVYPTLVKGRDQFEVEEVIEDIDLCRLRYTSEVLFSRVTDSGILRGIIPVNRLAYIIEHLNYAYGHASLMQPLAYPDNWNEYVCKYYGTISSYEKKFPQKKSKKSSVRGANIRSKSKVPYHLQLAKKRGTTN